ncbi:hypothetical protein PI125_g2100 [Phytophthora idaei]|nr:hypothetical protein PI125_g2100 [Phytophthora idaei]
MRTKALQSRYVPKGLWDVQLVRFGGSLLDGMFPSENTVERQQQERRGTAVEQLGELLFTLQRERPWKCRMVETLRGIIKTASHGLASTPPNNEGGRRETKGKSHPPLA